jgi:O-antigen/teichoic acid export membrane protein
MSLKTKIFSHTKYQLMSDVFLMILGIISSVVYARILGPGDFGRLNFLLWLITIFGLIVGMGFNGTLSRFVSLHQGKNEIEKSEKIISSILSFELGLSIFVVIALLVFKDSISKFFNEPSLSSVFLVIVMTVIPSAIADVLRYSLVGLQKIKELALINIIIQASAFAASLAAILMGYGIQGLIVVNFLLLFPRLYVLQRILRKTLKIKWFNYTDKSLFKDIFKYNLSLSVIVITDQIIWERSEIFFLQKYSSPEQIAYYSLAFGWGMRVIGFLPGILGGFLIPVMTELYGKNDFTQIKKAFFFLSKYLAVFLIPMTLGAIAVSKNLIYVLYGDDYSIVPVLFIPIFLSKGFISLYVTASALIFASGRQNFIVKWGSALAFFNIVLDYFMIRTYAALGAVCATSITHFLAAVITLVYLKKHIGVEIPFRFQLKILLASLPMFLVAYLISVNSLNVAGLLIAVLSGVALYMFTVKLMKVFSEEDTDTLLFFKEKMPGFLKPSYARYFNL